MTIMNSSKQYGDLAKFFHWTIFFLVFGMLVCGYFMGDIANKILRSEIINAHKLIGLLILVLMCLRAIWAVANIKPKSSVVARPWEKFAEKLVHYLLYFMLFLMPISGWVMSTAGGKPPRYAGVSLSLPINQNKAMSNTAFDLHSEIAIIIIALICIHVLAAFYHYFVKKDDVLQRML
jgi:cytochrome b561